MNASSLSPIFSPISVGSVKIKNRLAVAPMVTCFCDKEGMATDRFIAYHEAKARGGWGLIIVEDYAVDPAGRGFWTAGLWKDEQIASHAKLVEKVHCTGTKIVAQIYHAGRQTTSGLIGSQPVCPSPLACPALGEVPRELTVEEIRYIVSQFGDTARRAQQAGFDGVEVHGAHGYLVAEFMSKYANKRVDEYGGPLGNRLRFPLEIIADIREKCGPDFLIDFRISGDEKVAGGRTIEETKAIAVQLEEAGVDMLHITAGTYESSWAIIPPMQIGTGWIVDYAAEVKSVVSIPVITVGRINDPLLAESILLSGKADLIAMGRASLADPELPNKFLEGRYEDIRQCIGCQQGCLEVLFRNEPIGCLVNPSCGYEYLDELKRAKSPRRVTVVGGGPAGMEAARAAALAGHEVTLYEKMGRLGGQFAVAAVAPGKGDVAAYLSWASRQIEKLGVHIKLNTEYTAEACRKEKPDNVIVATGATSAKPAIPGIDGENVSYAVDVLSGRIPAAGTVVIAGGGVIGCETAVYLASLGKAVTIVEMLPSIARDEEGTRRFMLMKMMEEAKITVCTDSEITEIAADGVTTKKDGDSCRIPADAVVLAFGMTSNNSLAKELEGQITLTVVGDAAKARKALEAIREGWLAGARIE